MSIEAMSWAWKQDTGNASAKLVLLAIADHANGDGYCWPSMKRVGLMVGLSDRQVSNHITALAARGLIVKAGRRRWEGQYRGWSYLLPTSGSPLPVVEPSSGSPLPVATGSPLPSPAEAGFRSEPSENPKEEPLRRKRREPDLIFEAIAEACGHRLDRLTNMERGRLNKAAKELKDAGASPEDVQEASRAWVRMYPSANLTATALASHWSTLVKAKAMGRVESCCDCGGPMKGHTDELCAAFRD